MCANIETLSKEMRRIHEEMASIVEGMNRDGVPAATRQLADLIQSQTALMELMFQASNERTGEMDRKLDQILVGMARIKKFHSIDDD